jgi:hypothetical protein
VEWDGASAIAVASNATKKEGFGCVRMYRMSKISCEMKSKVKRGKVECGRREREQEGTLETVAIKYPSALYRTLYLGSKYTSMD